jgi:hypothetical protein
MKPIHVKSDRFEGLPSRTIYKVGAPEYLAECGELYFEMVAGRGWGNNRTHLLTTAEGTRLREALTVAIQAATVETQPEIITLPVDARDINGDLLDPTRSYYMPVDGGPPIPADQAILV